MRFQLEEWLVAAKEQITLPLVSEEDKQDTHRAQHVHQKAKAKQK